MIHRIFTLFGKLVSGSIDVVYGSRYLKKSGLQEGRFILQSGVRLLNWMTRLLYGVSLTDQATCYKLFHKTDLQRMKLQCQRFEFCAEVTAKAALLNLQFSELPISYSPRMYSDGKKFSLMDGVSAAWTMVRYFGWSEDLRQRIVRAKRAVNCQGCKGGFGMRKPQVADDS